MSRTSNLLVTRSFARKMIARLLCYHVLALGLLANGLTANDVTYRAGIVEFKPPGPAATKQETVLKNARLYGQYAASAAEMGVQILIFPEYGLVTLNDLGDRESVAGYLQDVPDPKLHQWNPCQEPDKFNNTQVLHELSCAAQDNSLVIVANLLSREPCDPKNNLEQTTPSSHCPADGHYQFNTNVIFAQNGTFIARYHKRHLFEENYADPAPEPEYVILDLGFVRIATFVCFDILFARPAVELVEKYGIRNIAFPTAWVNELPYMTAPQAFSSIAYGLGINILAANYFHPETGALGSGIFSSTRGVLNGTWDISTPGRLVIADVPVEPANATTNDENLSCDFPKKSQENLLTNSRSAVPPYIFTDKPSSKHANKTHRILYQSLSNFTSVILTGMEGNITQLCQGSVCCNVSYKFVTKDINDTYRLVANSGISVTPGGYKMGMQVCSVLRCEVRDDIETCGRVPDPDHTPETSFERLIITGNFQTRHLYPSVFSTRLGLLNTNRWKFVKRVCHDDGGNGLDNFTVGKLNITTALERSILEASIVGRVYEWD